MHLHPSSIRLSRRLLANAFASFAFLIFVVAPGTGRTQETPDPYGQTTHLEQILPPPLVSPDTFDFGATVAISADTTVVTGSDAEGAPAVFCYGRVGESWVLQQMLTRPNDPETDGGFGFGASLAISGNTLVIGDTAFRRAEYKGVHVYTRSGTLWTLQQTIPQPPPFPGTFGTLENFGATVAIQGDTLVVGAPNARVKEQSSSNDGAVFVFVRNGTTWTQSQRLLQSRGVTTDEHFGIELAIDGDTIAVGTSSWYEPTGDGGSTYIFVRNGDAWEEQQRIVAPDRYHFTFGTSIALTGNWLFIGNPRVNQDGVIVTGEVMFYEREGTAWHHRQNIRQNGRSPDDCFGTSIAAQGDTLLVSTRPENSSGQHIEPGAVYLFERSGAGWVEVQKLVSGHTDPDSFGAKVAMFEDRFITGASWANEYLGEAQIFKMPAVSLRLTTPQQNYMRGETFMAEVSARLRVSRPISIQFEEPLVGTDVPTILAVEETELPGLVELTPDEPNAVFPVAVSAADFGTAKLETSAIADDAGELGRICAERSIVINPLIVTLQMKPLVEGKPIVNLRLDEEGKVTDENGNEVTPKVEVTVENLSDQPVRASLQGVDPRARDQSAALGRISTQAPFPIFFGVISPGAKVQHEVDVQINEDGRYEFVALVSGSTEGTGVGFNSSARGAPIAVGERYPVELELDFVRTPAITGQNNGAFLMQPGSSLEVIASVTNHTTNSTLKFYGIKAEKRLNAFGAILTSDDGRLSDPPFAHDHSVDAGSSVILSGKVLTEGEGGAPSGTVKWLGLQNIVLVDDETGEETELSMDDVLLKDTFGGWLGDPLAIRIVQDYLRDFAPPALTDIEAVAVWSYGAMLGIGQWCYDGVDAIGGIGRVAGHIAADPTALARVMGDGARAVWEAAELAATTWAHMSPQDREEFVLSVAAEVQRRAALLLEAPFDPENYQAAYQFTLDATYGLFGGMEAAYASDDPAQIAEMWGKVSGNVAMEVITAAIPTPKFNKFTKAAELTKLADNNALGKAMNVQETFLRTVKSGPLDVETTITHWGIGGQNLEDIQDLFRHFGVKGYARERGPEAYRLIDELGEAVWKPEAMKPKGISDIDLLLLDHDVPVIRGKNGQDLGAEGITAIFMPEPDDVLTARLRAQGHSDEIIDVCLSRAQLRREEFEKYVPEFEAWSRPASEGGGIPVSKNYKDNGVPDPVNDPGTPRPFRFERHRREGKPTIYIPQMMTADLTEYRYISGDIDWIHFSFRDDTPLNAEVAGRLYDAMSRCCGLQHPETISWINNMQTVFKGKANQIGEYMRSGPNQKALLEVSGDGVRAAHVSEKLTRFSADGRNHLVFFDGGLKSRLRATAADIETAFRYFQDRFPDRRLIAPFLWLSKYDSEDSTVGGREWSFTTSDNAILARQGTSSTIEIFDGTKWNSASIASLPSPLALTPATGLSANVSAGATTVPIVELPTLWPDEMAGRVAEWFAAGQTVVIAPGEPTQEIRQVIGLGSLILDQPLALDHPEGTQVAVIPTGLGVDSDADGMPDSFELTYFGSTIAGQPNDDSDGDGAVNLQEFHAGTNPQDANSVFRIQGIRREGNDIVLTFPGVTGKSYRVESAEALDKPFSLVITTIPALAEDTMLEARHVDGGFDSARFYRVVVITPP